MKYIPAPDLWDPETEKKLRNGQIKLQPGQPVRCGGKRCAIFVGVTKYTIWVIHHCNGYDWDKFKTQLKSLKAANV